jgi:hypothetical protein
MSACANLGKKEHRRNDTSRLLDTCITRIVVASGLKSRKNFNTSSDFTRLV